METIERNRQIFGLIAQTGHQDQCVGTTNMIRQEKLLINIATMKAQGGEQEQERKAKMEVMNDLKYKWNYVKRFLKV